MQMNCNTVTKQLEQHRDTAGSGVTASVGNAGTLRASDKQVTAMTALSGDGSGWQGLGAEIAFPHTCVESSDSSLLYQDACKDNPTSKRADMMTN